MSKEVGEEERGAGGAGGGGGGGRFIQEEWTGEATTPHPSMLRLPCMGRMRLNVMMSRRRQVIGAGTGSAGTQSLSGRERQGQEPQAP